MRPKAIETPELMWELFQDYEKWVKENPIKVEDYVGKDGVRVYREKNRPYTMEGFESYLFDRGVISDLSQYFANREGRYELFVPILRTIRGKIRTHQVEGGMAGIYNPSLTARINGLVEKTENKHEVSEIKITHDK
jgi:hypothetical protein